jgi:hypothetical protein
MQVKSITYERGWYYYHDGERFARVYIDRDKARRLAERQKKSPIVGMTRVTELS